MWPEHLSSTATEWRVHFQCSPPLPSAFSYTGYASSYVQRFGTQISECLVCAAIFLRSAERVQLATVKLEKARLPKMQIRW